jgi:hypothetical protein
VKFQKLFRRSFGFVFLCVWFLPTAFFGQEQKATLNINQPAREMPLAAGNNLYCAGYVEEGTVDTSIKIVGAENEQEQFIYSQGNNVFINAGASRGVKVGDMFAVIRPRGRVETRWSKKNDLGFYVQEVGALEVISVKNDVSVAQVKVSCDNLMLGDLLQPVPSRTSPTFVQRPKLNVFADPSGKAMGRIFMARDGRELIGREQIVYIDLGSEDGAKIGDYLTVFRPLGKGGIVPYSQKETLSARDEGFQSDIFRGGKFSNQAPRKKGEKANGRIETTAGAKENRPGNLRKVVGELVILNVQGKTATAMVVRTAQEIHTGDWVELQ